MLLLLPVYSIALMFPSDPVMLVFRVGVQVSLWGVCFFWYTLFPKEMKRVTLCVALFMVLLPVADLLYKSDSVWRILPVLNIYTVGCCQYITFLLWGKSEKLSKNLLSIEKLKKAMHRGILLSMTSVAALIIFSVFPPGNTVSYFTIALFSTFPLLGLRYHKPQCLLYNEKLELKRKAYLLGRSIKGGNQLEDDGGIINESVVEDARIIYAIITLFEKEKLYLKSDIKLVDVAKMVGTNKTYLSRALNTRLSKNFCQFVNHFRVRDACELYIKNPDQDMRPLAEQCGFSSQSTFSMVFKSTTGYTPGDWSRMVKLKLMNDEKVKVEDYLL